MVMRKNQPAPSFCLPRPFVSSILTLPPSEATLPRRSLQKKKKKASLVGVGYVNAITTNTVSICLAQIERAHSCSLRFVAVKQSSKTWNKSSFPPCCLLAIWARSQHHALTSSPHSPPAPPLAYPATFSHVAFTRPLSLGRKGK